MLAGTFLSNIGLAVTEFRRQEEGVLPRRRAADRQDHLAERQQIHVPPARLDLHAGGDADAGAVAAKKKRWALVYPNFEYGQAAAAAFKELMKEEQPDVEFVTEQAPPLGKIDAGAVAQAIDDAKPDAIFNVLFGGDLAKFVREGNTRGMFKNRTVVSLLSGEPEYLDPLKDEAPVGWIVTGYPWDKIKTPEHKAFVDAYQKKYNDYPRLGSVVGYVTIKSLAAGIAKAESTDTEKLVAAFKGLKVDSPFGPFEYRASDHQATMGCLRRQDRARERQGHHDRLQICRRRLGAARPMPRSRSCARRRIEDLTHPALASPLRLWERVPERRRSRARAGQG